MSSRDDRGPLSANSGHPAGFAERYPGYNPSMSSPEDTRRRRAARRDDVEGICVEYAQTRDARLKDEIVESHQWLVLVCARQMQRRREPIEDLVQVGNVGLLQALERFDPTFGVSFRTYASATILGVLRRHYRSTWRLKVPRRIQELHILVSRAIEELTSELQRSPSVAEIASHVHATDEDVIEALDAGANFWPLSLAYGTDNDGSRPPERMLAEDDQDHVEQRMEVRALLSTLPEREQRVLYMRFFQDQTQTEIGDALGLSQVHVSRIMRSALAQLRNRKE